MHYYNAHRAYQATFLLDQLQLAAHADGYKPKAKDHRVLHAHRVLEVLGRKMATPSKGERDRRIITDTCFPSLRLLARETQLSESTVRDALTDLITWGFITKTRDPGHRPSNPKTGSVYEHCRYWVVTEVWDAVESPFAPGRVASSASPVVPTADDTTGATELDVEFRKPEKRSPEELLHIRQIEDLLRDKFGGHATYGEPRADAIMRTCIEHCVSIAGNTKRCLVLLRWKLGSQELVEKVMSSAKQLGGYIKTSFRGWFDVWQEFYLTESLDAACRGFGTPCSPDSAFESSYFIQRLGETFADGLLSVEERPGDGAVDVMAKITDRAKIAWLLSHWTGRQVSADAVPDFVDSSAVEQVIRMLDDDRWAEDIREAKDPLKYFFEHWDEVEGPEEGEVVAGDDAALR